MTEPFIQPDRPLETLEVEQEFSRVAVLSDVHGNLPALEACLGDVEREHVEAVMFIGDLTWGPQPREVLAVAKSIGVPAWYVRGNAERAVIELAAGTRLPEGPNDEWMVKAHGTAGVATISTFSAALQIRINKLGKIRLCHGSPRSDIELLTPATSPERIARATVGVEAAVIGHGHTHLQYQRIVGGRTIFGPGSVGLPYATDGRHGARWALLSDSIELRCSPYDIERAIGAAYAVGYPGRTFIENLLRTPPTLQEIVESAEPMQFSD